MARCTAKCPNRPAQRTFYVSARMSKVDPDVWTGCVSQVSFLLDIGNHAILQLPMVPNMAYLPGLSRGTDQRSIIS